MKARFIFSPIVLLVALSIILSSCTEMANKLAGMAINYQFEFEREDTIKWGKVIENDLTLPAFSAIDAEGVVCVIFTQDSTCSVSVRANEKCLDAYKFEVRKDELNIKLKDSKSSYDKKTPGVTLYVSAPLLTSVELSGAGKVEMRNQTDMQGILEVELNGACNFVVDTLLVDGLDLEANGAAKCTLAKVSAKEDIEIEINGAGDISANVFCQDLRVELNGASKGVFTGECQKIVCDENGASKVDFSNLKR